MLWRVAQVLAQEAQRALQVLLRICLEEVEDYGKTVLDPAWEALLKSHRRAAENQYARLSISHGHHEYNFTSIGSICERYGQGDFLVKRTLGSSEHL